MNNKSIQISPQPSKLQTYQYSETVDKELLVDLIASGAIEADFKDRGLPVEQLKQIQTQLQSIKSSLKSNKMPVRYEFTQKHSYGRIYPRKGLSYCSMSKRLRHTLAQSHYVDFDIENAHPHILFQICEANNISTPTLQDYVANRESRLQELMNYYECSRKKAKEFFLIAIYGGGFNTWKDDDEHPIKSPDKKQMKFMTEFQNDVKKIMTVVANANPDLVEKCKDKCNPKASALSIYAQEKERFILEHMFDYFVKNKMIVKSRAKLKDYDCVLCFDGIMTPIQNLPTDKSLDMICTELGSYIQHNTGFKLGFDTKSMDCPYDTSTQQEVEIDDGVVIDMDKDRPFYIKDCELMFLNAINHNYYLRKKKYLEFASLQLAQVADSFAYVLDGEVIFNSAEKLSSTFKPIWSGEFDENDHKIPFMNKWLSCEFKRFHHKPEFYPLRIDESPPDHIYNLFQGYNPVIKRNNPFVSPGQKKKQMEILGDFLELVGAQCQCDPVMRDFFLKWFATTVQTPREKIPIAFVFVGNQGTGVSTMMRLLDCIFRRQQFIDSASVDDFFGNHAEGFVGKLHINMNEISLEKTYKYCEAIKSVITEDKIRVNPKNIRPYDVNNFARNTFTTNNLDGIPIDVKTGDRRFVAFQRSSILHDKWKTDMWKKLRALRDNDDFVNALFWYLMELDIEGIDWERDRPITEVYGEMVEVNAPPIALFMEWFITEQKFVGLDETPGRCLLEVDEEEEWGQSEVVEVCYKDHPLYKESVRFNPTRLYKSFKKWAETFNMFNKGIPSSAKFVKLLSVFENIQKNKTNGKRNYTFVAKTVMTEMETRKWIMKDD